MLYTTCPTCGFFIAQVIEEYENKKEEICSNPNLSAKERDSNISVLLKSLKIRRYCCRMRIMTYKDMVKEILPVQN